MKISKSEVGFLLTVFLVCVAAACIVVFGMWFMLGQFVKAFGLEQYHDHFNAALALFVIYKLRQFYVAFRVFTISCAAKYAFADLVLKNRPADKHLPAKDFDISMQTLRVYEEDTARMCKRWFFRIPKTYSFCGYRFTGFIFPSALYDSVTIGRASSFDCNLDTLEFRFTKHAKTTDLFAFGFPVFKVLMEHKMNNNSEFTDWLLSYCPEKGIGMRYVPEKK